MSENIINNHSIIALLEKLGLSKNEIKCYLASLALSSAKISEVARVAKVNRVNAYDAIGALIKCGLIEQEATVGGRIIRPASLENLTEYARDHQKKATKLRWKIEDLVPTLLALSTDQTRQTTTEFEGVTIFKGDEGFERIAERTLAVARGSVNYYIEIEDLFHLESNLTYDEDYYIPTRVGRNISARVLACDSAFGKRLVAHDLSEIRETRFLTSEMNFPCAIFIYGDEVAFVWKSDEIVCVVIKGSPIVAVMKTLFELVWQMAGSSKRTKNKK